ncbi:PREDICTED: uncharacterized protein LOC108569940 isoform X10 [Nicrophorus vespilloides]|uniref:Uncharacterized protein LOC108569940 isoform X10 n=1 Tax=Nicrophorus vespilloides TaxID=110193 RepID=A0ABM1NK54_NICVS|nr:PREDICTED: uncharacterized protein LOC108569940 isoform X10 [Nicrophorus vespilloides]
MEKLMMFNSSASRIEPEWLDVMNFSARLTCSIVGIVSNLITIFIIGKINTKMSEMDKKIMMLSINNLLFLINSIVQQFVIRYMEPNKLRTCLLVNYELALFMSCVMAILVMLYTSKEPTAEEMSDNGLVYILYTLVVISLVFQTLFCFTQINDRYFDLIVNFCFFVCFGALIRNEVIICWKLYNREATCPSPPVCMNFARIFVYNYLITIILFAIFNPNGILVLIRSTTFITSFYIMIYLIYSNKKFRFFLLNSLRCKSTNLGSELLDDEDVPTINL